jgi:hypothetical protein
MDKTNRLTAEAAAKIAITGPTFNVEDTLDSVLRDIQEKARFSEHNHKILQVIYHTELTSAHLFWERFSFESRNALINELELLGYTCSELKRKDDGKLYLNVQW